MDCILKTFIRSIYFQNLKYNLYKEGVYFSFNFDWYSIQLDTRLFQIAVRGWGRIPPSGGELETLLEWGEFFYRSNEAMNTAKNEDFIWLFSGGRDFYRGGNKNLVGSSLLGVGNFSRRERNKHIFS